MRCWVKSGFRIGNSGLRNALRLTGVLLDTRSPALDTACE